MEPPQVADLPAAAARSSQAEGRKGVRTPKGPAKKGPRRRSCKPRSSLQTLMEPPQSVLISSLLPRGLPRRAGPKGLRNPKGPAREGPRRRGCTPRFSLQNLIEPRKCADLPASPARSFQAGGSKRSPNPKRSREGRRRRSCKPRSSSQTLISPRLPQDLPRRGKEKGCEPQQVQPGRARPRRRGCKPRSSLQALMGVPPSVLISPRLPRGLLRRGKEKGCKPQKVQPRRARPRRCGCKPRFSVHA